MLWFKLHIAGFVNSWLRLATVGSIVLAASGLFVGCETYPADVSQAEAASLSELPYPKDSDYGDDLDVVVVYDMNYFRSADVQLINREPRTVGPGLLWINQQYVTRLTEPIEIGTNNYVSLTSLINYYREPFPVGLFFSPDKSQPVVLAELYDPQTDLRHRLYVQEPELQATLD